MPISSASFVRATLMMLLVGVVTLIVLVGMSVWLSDRARTYSEAVIDAQQARAQMSGLFRLLQDAETSQRGYLLTGERQYLAPYTAAVEQIPVSIATLEASFREDPEELAGLQVLTDLVRQKLAELSETISLAGSGRNAEALAIIKSDRGETMMSRARESFNVILSHIDGRLTGAAERMQSSAWALNWATFAGAVVILLVAGGSARSVVRYTGELRSTQREVEALNSSLEGRVQERTTELARANDEIQRFAYIVSHDLRAPLVNVMGFTSELEEGLSTVRQYVESQAADESDTHAAAIRTVINEELPEAISFIRSSTAKMDGLINAILKLSREGRRVLRSEPIDMSAMLETTISTLSHQLSEAGAEAVVGLPMPEIVSDRMAIEQVFGNLLDNAVKYLDPARPGRIEVRGHPRHGQLVYEVSDNGRGIAPQDFERVFELFRRAGTQDRKGEGIGLAHVRALVRRLGGDITVESTLGQGTTFRVTLPRNLHALQQGVST